MSSGPSAGLRGRLPVKPPGERLAINFVHKYLRAPLGSPKYPIDVSGGITQWQMLGNGPDPALTVNGGRPVGDCTFAGRQHLRMAKAAARGKVENWETANEVVSEYLAFDGGVDRGANIAEVLLDWFLAGKILAFAPVDHADPEGCDGVMAAFHGLYVGVDLTDAADSQFNAGEPWTVANGERPDPNDGHCIVKVMTDGRTADTWVTWGALQKSSREWTAACIREAWAIVTTEDEAAKLDMPALLADITAASKTAAPTAGGGGGAGGGTGRNTGANAFSLGWQMAQLYGPLPVRRSAGPVDHLPSIAEYDTPARVDLGIDLVKRYLKRAGLQDLDRHGRLEARRTEEPEYRKVELQKLHHNVLDAFACDDPGQAASYELGRALSDTCWFPDTDRVLADGSRRVDVFLDQFSRDRLATLQGWLGQMTPLAPQAAPIVSRSIHNWSEWAATNARTLERDWDKHEEAVVTALRNQGSAWFRLLSSESPDQGQPPIGAWIHAGEAIVRSMRATAAKMILWFWPVAVVILAATGGLLYLAIANASGTAKVWTALVTLAAGLSASAAGLRSGANRLAGGLEQTTWEAASTEAEAWAVTWLPTIRQSLLSRYRLRKSGVDPPQTGVRLERVRAASPPEGQRAD